MKAKMLKIKDNVDLKELEKYGVIKKEGNFVGIVGEIYCGIGETIYITGYEIDYSDDDSALSVLYDLIKADLVEKVDEYV